MHQQNHPHGNHGDQADPASDPEANNRDFDAIRDALGVDMAEQAVGVGEETKIKARKG